MAKKHRRVTLRGKCWERAQSELDALLEEGWLVAQMCPYSENVAVSWGAASGSWIGKDAYTHGDYGVIVILEKEEDDEEYPADVIR